MLHFALADVYYGYSFKTKCMTLNKLLFRIPVFITISDTQCNLRYFGPATVFLLDHTVIFNRPKFSESLVFSFHMPYTCLSFKTFSIFIYLYQQIYIIHI